MEITDEQIAEAEAAMEAELAAGYATAARYDHKSKRLIVSIHNGIELAIPVRMIQGLSAADPADLAEVEISPAGLGLHWPHIDADVYVPGLLSGLFGTRRWMEHLRAESVQAISPAGVAVSRKADVKSGLSRKQTR